MSDEEENGDVSEEEEVVPAGVWACRAGLAPVLPDLELGCDVIFHNIDRESL